MTGGTPTPLPGSGHLDDRQHRVRRNPILFTTPVVLLVALTAMVFWEATRMNLSPALKEQWPWRLALLDAEALCSLLAVCLAFVLGRAQFARAVRPIIGWYGYVSRDTNAGNRRARFRARPELIWVVGLRNGGMHSATLVSVEYHVQPKGERVPITEIQWLGYAAAVAELEALGLRLGKDFDLHAIGAGTPLGLTGDRDGVYTARFSVPAVSLLDNMYVRIRVLDAVGDTHERILHCLRGAEIEIRSAVAGES